MKKEINCLYLLVNKMKNKKGDDRLLAIWLFVILGLIGISIVVSVWIFFSAGFDIRYEEAETLIDKITYAISDSGYIDKEIFNDNYDILKKAQINPKFFDNGGLMYFNITIYNFNSINKSIPKGNGEYEIYCRINGKYFPKCFEKMFLLTDPTNSSNIYRVKILSAANLKEV